MKKTAVALLTAIGIGGSEDAADRTVAPIVSSHFDYQLGESGFTLDPVPTRHFKRPLYRKLCFGLCPDLERVS
jgi:hypothetical protein